MYENLPQLLKDQYPFCRWRYEVRNGNRTKVPYRTDGRRADSGNRNCFTDFSTAFSDLTGFDGIGVGVFDDLVAIDIDDCATGGVLSPMAEDIVNTVDSYTEITPSGKGVRILCRAENLLYDKGKYYINNRQLHLEIYAGGTTKKFVTVTGNCIRERGLENRGEQVMLILEKYMLRPRPKQQTASLPAPESILADDDLVSRALASKQGDRFRRLWTGDITGYPSHSEADLALSKMLAFWCAGDREQMDRLFRKSGLMREKWEREDYRETTLTKALSITTVYFHPPRKP